MKILLCVLAVYAVVLTFTYAVLGIARKSDEIAEYQYEKEFGEHESR